MSDTSPLSYLAKLGKLDLLPRLFETVAVPTAVAKEWARDTSNSAARIQTLESGWLRILSPVDRGAVAEMMLVLDQGEAEAIVLAQELAANLLLIDDEDGRKMAQRCGLEITGVLGVLLRAKRAGLISAVRPEAERLLKETTFFCAGTLLEQVLNLVGE